MQREYTFTIMKFASCVEVNYPFITLYLTTITVAIAQIDSLLLVPLSCHVKPFVCFIIKITLTVYENFKWNRDLLEAFFFSVEPQVLNIECPTSITEGSNVTLQCNATGNPPSNFTWIWQNTGDVLGSSEQLTLIAVNRTQAGTYQCLASNGIGNNATSACLLDVFCKSDIYLSLQ